jgi:hypothetical protein
MGSGSRPRSRRQVDIGGIPSGDPTIDCPSKGVLPARLVEGLPDERDGELLLVGDDLVLVSPIGVQLAAAETNDKAKDVRNCIRDGYRYHGGLQEAGGRWTILFEA